jgi:cytochrome c oxidase assembly factor CtaG
LAVVLSMASAPLYSHYADLTSRPGGISALTDQQLAAGVMWVPGSIPLLVAIVLVLHRWLEPKSRRVTAS